MGFPDLSCMLWLEGWLLGSSRADGKSVLVVEDDICLKPALARVIYSVDPTISIRWTTCVPEAKDALMDEVPGLIIADCLLGRGASGLALWDECRRDLPKTPFLMMTGLTEQTLRSMSPAEGHVLPKVIRKPLVFRDFQTRIKDLLEA